MKLNDQEAAFFTPPVPREIGFVTQAAFRRSMDEVLEVDAHSERPAARDALIGTAPLLQPPKGRYVPGPAAALRVDYRFGFPFSAMRCALEIPPFTRTRTPPTWHDMIWLYAPASATSGPFERNGRGSTSRIAVPRGVMPVGFAVNSVFFALAWWALLRGVQCVHRQGRDARGLCTRCAYDLRGLDAGATCPECGHTA
jgi:hypothetical protein